MDAGLGIGEDGFELAAALGERARAEVLVVKREEVEEDDGGRRLLREQLDAGGGGMDAELEGVKVEPVGAGDDDLAVEHAALRQVREERGFDPPESSG